MAITIHSTVFRQETKRFFTTRSAEYNNVLVRLQAHEQRRSKTTINALKAALDAWVQQGFKEIKTRNKNDIIARLGQQVANEYVFFQQLDIANTVANQLVSTRSPHIVNDADTSLANQGALKLSMVAQLSMVLAPDVGAQVMKANLGTRNRVHWETKGRQVAANPNMAIRCAESAALVVHMLRQNPQFMLPLSIIEQGNGSIDGHFWVIAGNITGNGTPNYGPDTFAIDLWGMGTGQIKSVIKGPPGRRPFPMSNNTLKTLVTWY